MTRTHHPLRIAVLLGGDSAERAVSLKSGAAVIEALTSLGHTVTPIDPSETTLESVSWSDIDMAFLALHGAFGEDGQVQTILERKGVPYTGSGPEASRLAFSKSAAKERFAQQHVPTSPYVLIHESDARSRIVSEAARLGYPLVVKPDTQGSSLGVTIVDSPDQLAAALEDCFRFDAFGLIEKFIAGSEWTVGVIDELPLPLIRIGTERQFYNYEAKYNDNATRYEFNTSAPAIVRNSIEAAALGACRAIGTRGVARVDLMVDENGKPWVLEVNTIPGFTDHSLVPKAAAHCGWSFADFCERVVRTTWHGNKQARVG